MDITIYTVLTGNYDTLKPPANKQYRHVVFSDSEKHIDGWEYVPVFEFSDFEFFNESEKNARISRHPKIYSHIYINSEYSIYHDANRRLITCPEELIEKYLADNDIAMYRHPHRNCIYDEANAVIRMKKDNKQNVLTQINKYKKSGFPSNYGLHAGGIIFRRNTNSTKDFNHFWGFAYYRNRSTRDQLSLDYTRWLTGIKIADIDGNYFHNSDFEIWKHNIT